jgi:protocatechuate 3,4-dioxygenase beta subunit
MTTPQNRRGFLRTGAVASGALVLARPAGRALAAACGLATPTQTAGPFYPGEAEFHPDADLTRVAGSASRANGQVVYVRGRVQDRSCSPVAGATVEIWQACASGRYDNPNDDNPAPLDPNFKYWGEASTGPDGAFVFKTIIPGAYPADTNWMRPPHIHFKVTRLGYKELITQMYFKGQALNDIDLILQAVPASQRPSVIVAFEPSPADLEPGSLVGDFAITLESVR